MWRVFRLTLKDQTGRTVRIYEVPVTQGIQALFSAPCSVRNGLRSGERRKSDSERA